MVRCTWSMVYRMSVSVLLVHTLVFNWVQFSSVARLQQVEVGFLPQRKKQKKHWSPWNNWNIVDRGIKYHNPNPCSKFVDCTFFKIIVQYVCFVKDRGTCDSCMLFWCLPYFCHVKVKDTYSIIYNYFWWVQMNKYLIFENFGESRTLLSKL